MKNQQGDEIIFILQYADAFDEGFEDTSFAQINSKEYIPLFANRFKKNNSANLYDFLLHKYQTL